MNTFAIALTIYLCIAVPIGLVIGKGLINSAEDISQGELRAALGGEV